MQPLLTPDDLAALLGVTKKSIYNRMSRGQIPTEVIVRVGGLLRFHPGKVNDWLSKKRGFQRE